MYIKNWSELKSNKLSKKYFRLTGRIISVLPQELLVQLFYIKDIENLINNKISRFKYNHKLSKLILEQRKINVKYNEYCNKNGILPLSFNKFDRTNQKQIFVNNLLLNQLKSKIN